MEQYTERHYDDDLTIGADDYDDSFQTPDIDLFEYAGADDSPIARLKSLVLSIDWEITDEVLLQFNEELLDLKDVWAGDQIRQVYLQALEKISKYIYREKADANPNSIKLLLALYYNLEKIVSSAEITEEEKKQLLLEDVRNFEKLKHQIKKMARGKKGKGDGPGLPAKAGLGDQGTPSRPNALTTLKAVILGIDWEITDKELLALQQEVGRLHEVFIASRPKLIFLQGIGTLGAYIRNKKSNAHADAFKLLHSFFAGLEQIVNNPSSLAEEKAILLPEVAKFNAFKETISASLAAESQRPEDEDEDSGKWEGQTDIQPAFADIPGETKGFQEEEAAAALGLAANIESNIARFFGEDDDLPDQSGEFARSRHQRSSLTSEGGQGALLGLVNPQEDDDGDEEAIAGAAGELSPALADEDDHWHTHSKIAGPETAAEDAVADELMTRLDDFFAQDTTSSESQLDPLAGSRGAGTLAVPAELALQGVNVETEGDDLEGADEIAAAVAEKSSDWLRPSPALESAASQDSPPPEDEVAPGRIDEQEGLAGEADFVLAEAEDVPEAMVDTASAALLADEDQLVGEPIDIADKWGYPADAADTCDEVLPIADHYELMTVDEDLLLEPFDQPEPLSQSAFESTLPAAEPGSWADQSVVDFATDDQAERALAFADSFAEVAAEPESIAVEPDQLDGSFRDDFEAIADLTHDDVDFILRASVESEEPLAAVVQDEMMMFAEDLPDPEPEVEYTGSPALLAEANENGFAFDRFTDGWADDGGLTVPSDGSGALSEAEEEIRSVFAAGDEYSAVFAGMDDAVDQVGGAGEDGAADEMGCAVLADAGHALSAVSAPTNTDIAGLLDGLGETIALLNRQSGDDAVQLLFRYINCLRQKWVGQPLAKIYLQLLSSVAQHIERRGDQADAGAQDLLRTVFRYLRGSWKNFELGQDQLLCATCKVLQWQHDMMMRPPAPPGAVTEVQDGDTGEELGTGSTEMIFGAGGTDRIGCANALPEAEELSSAVLRRELDFLRHALQDELAELRSALKTNPK